MQWAFRRNAPPAFELRPVPSSLSRPFGFNPSRLRVCGAARCACLQGIGATPIPAALCLAPLQDRRTGLCRIGQARYDTSLVFNIASNSCRT